ncbi:hypothetical protein [Lysinibacillus cavernae]|uniref:hypothetical protein n=1 Tax=Lysinibacillus cavernae TaxID=2666135 RepID=UPI0018C331F1|nr:hypothetical protein [Lysinibacillus cavernae]
MKPFIIHHKIGWLPSKLQYRKTYSIGFKGVENEVFTFKLTKNSTHVILKSDSREIVVSKRELKRYFKDGCLQFLSAQFEVNDMPVQAFGLGGSAKCPYCGKTFVMNDIDEEDDKYVEHVLMCEG